MIYVHSNDELCVKLNYLIHIRHFIYSTVPINKYFSFRKQSGFFSSLHGVKPTAIKNNEIFAINFGNKSK